MNPNLTNLRDVVQLKKREKNILQVLLPEFTLKKEGNQLLLKINVTKDQYSITNQAGKRQFFGALGTNGLSARNTIQKKLNDFLSDKNQIAYRFDCDDSPFRYANGGVLPVIQLDSVDYFCLFYRDIFPIGWNIANGSSDNLEELLDPGQVVFREFSEELLISDDENKLLYIYEPNQEDTSYGLQEDAWEVWKCFSPEKKLNEYKKLALPVKWIEGPDGVDSTVGNKKQTTKGYFLNINPEDNGIEVDKIALISLKDRISLFDGEVSNNKLCRRIVSLFEVTELRNKLVRGKIKGAEFKPQRFFFNGKECKGSLENIINKDYLHALSGFRTKEHILNYKAEKKKYDLCPVTRTIIQRYFDWEIESKEQTSQIPVENRKGYIRSAKECQVFITFKSTDEKIAVDLHEYLTKHGYNTFCSSVDISRLGESDYRKVIDVALESATCLVIVGTQKENFDSGWVRYEWISFMNEILSDRKPKGKIFTFVGSINIGDLPFGLRSMECIQFSLSRPHDSFERLHQFIKPTLV